MLVGAGFVGRVGMPAHSGQRGITLFRAGMTSLPSYVSYTRASQATYFNSAGSITTASVNEPRFDYNPLTLQPRGLLIEGARTNLLLNSAALSTQSVTVTAVQHTLSFYGTGSITLSGAATGTLNGTGAFPNRATLTFTPSAGSLTLTVTGTVEYAQCEIGAFASSYIPTTGVAATRSGEVPQVTNLSNIGYNTSQGALFFEFEMMSLAGSSNPFFLGIFNDGTDNNAIRASINNTTGTLRFGQGNGGTFSLTNTANAVTPGIVQKAAFSWQANSFSGVLNGGTVATVNPGLALPTVSTLDLGRGPTGLQLFGWMRQATYYPVKIPDAQIQSLTT